MLVRGASATPEGTPTASTPPVGRKRKHAVIDDDEALPINDGDIANAVQIARDDRKYRDRLTVSRHPIFAPVGDGSPFYAIEVSAVNRQLDKIGFKYVPAGLAAEDAAIPYRTIESAPQCTRVSWEDRNPSIKVTQNGLGLTTDKGFCSARANVCVQEGKWYMEVKIEKAGGEKVDNMSRMDGAHVRLGWGRREAPLNGPIGLDGYSYGIRDTTGEKVTLSRPRPYGKPFRTGDVIGLYISLPRRRTPDHKDPADPAHMHRERIPIDYKGQEYFESLDYPHSREMIALMDCSSKTAKAETQHQPKKSATVKNLPNDRTRNKVVMKPQAPLRELPVLRGSKISFFVNGECQGIAFQDIYDYLQLKPATKKVKEKAKRNKDGPREHIENNFDDGTLGYYPLFSLYGGAKIHLNAGPDFQYPPPPDVDALLTSSSISSQDRTWRPMSERYAEFMAQQWELDEKEEAALRKETGKAIPVAVLQKLDSEIPIALKEAIKTEKVAKLDKTKKEETTTDLTLDPEEAKKAIRREKKRIAEQQRRQRKKEEKLAAMAAATAAAASGQIGDFAPRMLNHVPLTLLPQPTPGPSFIPYVPPGMRVDERGIVTPSIENSPRTSTPMVKEEYREYPEGEIELEPVDVTHGTLIAQTPRSSDYGQGDWQSEGQSEDGRMGGADGGAETDDVDNMLEEELPDDTAPHGEAFRFEESSTRWGNGD